MGLKKKRNVPKRNKMSILPKGAPNKTILVVDDDLDYRITFIGYLKRKGYLTLEADSAPSALEVLQSQSIDLIISDIQMPKGDGFELAKGLKSFSTRPPLIFASAGVKLSEMELQHLGASCFLSKPVVGAELVLAIEQVFREAA